MITQLYCYNTKKTQVIKFIIQKIKKIVVLFFKLKKNNGKIYITKIK